MWEYTHSVSVVWALTELGFLRIISVGVVVVVVGGGFFLQFLFVNYFIVLLYFTSTCFIKGMNSERAWEIYKIHTFIHCHSLTKLNTIN